MKRITTQRFDGSVSVGYEVSNRELRIVTWINTRILRSFGLTIWYQLSNGRARRVIGRRA